MTNKLQIVSREQAIRLCEVGFDWETRFFYNKIGKHADTIGVQSEQYYQNWNKGKVYVSAPSIALALKWFRDVKEIHNTVNIHHIRDGFGEIFKYKGVKDFSNLFLTQTEEIFDNYEAAESALLDELLDLVINDKKD